MPHKRKSDKIDKREESFKVKRVKKTVEVLLGIRDGKIDPNDVAEFWERDLADALVFLESANAAAASAAAPAAANGNAASSSTDPAPEPTSVNNLEPTIEAEISVVDQTTNPTTG